MPANHRRTTCEFCNHLIAVSKIDRHLPLCEKRTPEEREEAFKQIETRRRWAAANRKERVPKTPSPAATAAASVDVYENMAAQLKQMYPKGIPTGNTAHTVRLLHWVFSTFSLLKQQAS